MKKIKYLVLLNRTYNLKNEEERRKCNNPRLPTSRVSSGEEIYACGSSNWGREFHITRTFS